MSIRKSRLIFIALAGLSLFLLILYLLDNNESALYASYVSPDRRFRLEVYAFDIKTGFPGQAGDAAGYVVLKDARGRVIKRKDVKMVQLIDNPMWSEAKVSQKLLFEWELPREY